MKTQPLFSYENAFSRNRGLVSQSEQERLRQARVAIPGMGGVGGVHLITLARLGIGNFHIADADTYDQANFNRQYGATMSSLGKSKVDVMEAMAKEVNPDLGIQKWDAFIDDRNIEAFLDGCDLVIDSLDAFATEARRTLFVEAQKRNIPVITAGPIGFASAMLVFTGNSMSFDDYFAYHLHGKGSEFLSFLMGLVPKPYFLKYIDLKEVDVSSHRGPSLASSVNLCSGFAGVEALKLLLGRGKVNTAPHFHYFDPYLMRFKVGRLPMGNRNPLQRIKFWALNRKLMGKTK